ncbi:MAG: hypothetical protein KF757_09280 [Phycisphaeraceae bacterium]|nr:hypothetical protein [Phycisphaeraceae bacterium]
MMKTGLTFDEYVELCLKPPAETSRDFHAAAEAERDRMFPMTKAAASNHLRSRGYDCRPPMLDMLIEHGVVSLSQPDIWTRSDVNAAAEHFDACQIFLPFAAMCEAMGCRYANILRAMRGESV